MLDIFSLIAPLVTASLSPDIAPGPVCRPYSCYFEGCQVGDDGEQGGVGIAFKETQPPP